MKKKFESIFENLGDEEFEDVLNECGFEFKKVDGKGGLKINGENISSEMLKKEILEYLKIKECKEIE